jgi:hypothetical protein
VKTFLFYSVRKNKLNERVYLVAVSSVHTRGVSQSIFYFCKQLVSDFHNSSALLVLNGSFGQANRRQWRWIRCEFFEFFAFFVEDYFVIGAGIGCGFGLGWGFGGIYFNETFPGLTLSF